MFVRCSNSSADIFRGGTPEHTQTVIDATQKQTAIDQQHSCETLICQPSNNTKAFVQCCHGKHKVASSRTLLSFHVVYWYCQYRK